MASLPLAFGELLIGGVMMAAAIESSKGSIADAVSGQAHGIAPFDTGGSGGSGAAGASGASGGAAGATGTAGAAPLNLKPGQYANPFPSGITPGRVDQGVDTVLTGPFRAPGNSKIVQVNAHDSGWQGGSVLGTFLDGPAKGKTWYIAENIAPAVTAGQTVSAGTPVATPAQVGSYGQAAGGSESGIVRSFGGGSFSSDGTMAIWWANFVHALGAPAFTNRAGAGHA